MTLTSGVNQVEVIYTLLCGDVGALATEHPEPAMATQRRQGAVPTR